MTESNKDSDKVSVAKDARPREAIDSANGRLRFGIQILYGECVRQSFANAVMDAAHIARVLDVTGFPVQATILRTHIHRAMAHGDFLQRAKPGDRRYVWFSPMLGDWHLQDLHHAKRGDSRPKAERDSKC